MGIMLRRKDLGGRGENQAADYLRRQGYQILAERFRWRGGEVDLVARDGDCLVFVEVKARSGHRFGLPEEAITARKRSKLIRTAQFYLARARLQSAVRFDVVAISGGQLRLYKNAFTLE